MVRDRAKRTKVIWDQRAIICKGAILENFIIFQHFYESYKNLRFFEKSSYLENGKRQSDPDKKNYL